MTDLTRSCMIRLTDWVMLACLLSSIESIVMRVPAIRFHVP